MGRGKMPPRRRRPPRSLVLVEPETPAEVRDFTPESNDALEAMADALADAIADEMAIEFLISTGELEPR